ncbi:MAG TPA: hypothetical protein VFT45_02265 [Longimicrobium sp.]|nr:hypothetical protein [Longimicrobium sp.]
MPEPNAGAVLAHAIMQYRSGDLTTVEFCATYECLYNLEIDKDSLSPVHRSIFQQLFDDVIWYSPFPEDRARYPGYRDEIAIHLAVERAWHALCL